MPYLLAAEADKIQDFIFRSSRLREVVGASQLLTRFCRSVDDTLAKVHQGRVIVNDGGSFRIIFETREQAIAFGADLAELYRLALGGSLTVAEPVELNGDFRKANKMASNRLRWAKSHRQGVVAEVHMPYVAFCESCGVALAKRRDRLSGKRASRRSQYLCQTCQEKTAERNHTYQAILDEFYEAYCTFPDIQPKGNPKWPEDADDVAEFDLRKRNYVAYLVADGNGMGQIFGSCDRDQIAKLSQELSRVLRDSLAVPAARVRGQLPDKPDMIPILPLILGGDDLFALIPAPYALDFARQFCLAWEEQMRNLVKEVGLTDIPPPTIAAAVVICKSTYPYALAHRRASELLKKAKRQSKLLAAEKGEYLSAVNFEVILGNRLAGLDDRDDNRLILPTLRPYWVAKKGLSADAQERGDLHAGDQGGPGRAGEGLSADAQEGRIDLQILLAQRLALKDLPNKRLAELRRCFEDAPSTESVRDRTQALEDWTKHKLERILKRLSASSRSRVEEALAELGKPRKNGDSNHHWREIRRDAQSQPLAHGMLDLLEAWDFARELDKSPDEYEPQEEEA